METIVVEVNGIPEVQLSPDQMIDKLTMHFLRPRNGGGEVQMVLYPTSIDGQAFVIFESAVVAAEVLQHAHAFEVKGKAFPLTVKRAPQAVSAQMNMQVSTSLDFSMFSEEKREEVLSILHSQGFAVPRKISKQIDLECPFLKLKIVRAQLQQLLVRDMEQRKSSQPILNGHTSATAVNGHASGAIPKKTAGYVNGTAMHAGSRSPLISNWESSSYGSPKSPNVSSPASPASGGSGSIATYYSPSNDSTLSPSYQRPPSPRQHREAVFPVDTDALCFANSFRKEHIKELLGKWGTNISFQEGLDITTITLSGGNYAGAQVELQDLLEEIHRSLCTQTIHLRKYDQNLRREIGQRIMKYKDKFEVSVKQHDDTIIIVGSLKDSYLMKMILLGHNVDPPAPDRKGRGMERNSRRRSSSLPRHFKSSPKFDLGSQASAGVSSSPSHNQESFQYSSQATGISQSSPKTQSHRIRSNTESDNTVRKEKTQSKQEQNDLAPSSGAKASAIKTKKSLTPPAALQNFRSLIRRNKKDKVHEANH